MSLIGVNRMDDGIPVKSRRKRAVAEGERKVINVDAGVVEVVNEYAEGLEDKLGFRPTFAQALRYIVHELGKK